MSSDSETTQTIDLTVLRRRFTTRLRRSALDLYAVGAENMFGDTNPGLVRMNNEDSFCCCSRPDGLYSMAVVADGIGGQLSGEVASRICVSSMIRAWRNFVGKNPDATFANVENFLFSTIEKTGRSIYESAASGVSGAGHMGTTVAALMFSDSHAVVANAGDSRVYRVRAGRLSQLSLDHTIVAEKVARGELTPEEAKNSPFAHTITRSLGIHPSPNAEVNSFDHEPGDRYLLCSDGLTAHVTEKEISEVLYASYDPEQSVDKLLAMTLRRGAIDNVTVIAVFA